MQKLIFVTLLFGAMQATAQPCQCGTEKVNSDAYILQNLYHDKMQTGSGAGEPAEEQNAELCAQCAILAVDICLCKCADFNGDRELKLKQIAGSKDIIERVWRDYHGKKVPPQCQKVLDEVIYSCAGSGQGATSGPSTTVYSETEGLFAELEQAAANGDNAKVNEIKNKILELVQQKYSGKLEEIQKRISETIEKGKNQSGNKSAKNNYPAGWAYLKDYQKLLNDYITECNRAAGGGDPTPLLNIATKLSDWVTNNTNVFTQFTPEQSETLNKMTNYFSDAVMKCVTGTGGNLKQVNFADEAEKKQQDNFVPNIQTGTIYYTPNTKGNVISPSSGNGDLGNGNGMFRQEDPRHDVGPNEDQKLRTPKQ